MLSEIIWKTVTNLLWVIASRHFSCSSGVDKNGLLLEINLKIQFNSMVIKWFPSSVDEVLPRNIFEGGRMSDGSVIYVGRAFHNGNYLPAAIMPGKRCAKVSWNGRVYQKTNYELLVGNDYKWETFCEAHKKFYEKHAVSTGMTIFGDLTFVGRASFQGNLLIGQLQFTQKCLHVPFDHGELSLNSFEILVYDHTRESSEKMEESKFSKEKMLPEPEFQNIQANAVMFESPNYATTATANITTTSTSQTQPQPVSVPVPSPVSAPAQTLPTADTWLLASPGVVPSKAVHAGYDIDGSLIYVARVFHAGSYVPAKAIPVHNTALIPYNGQEICKPIFEYLVGDNYKWLKFTAAETFPTTAVIANPLISENLCIGRTVHGGSLLCGKIVRSQQMLYVPFNYQEVPISPPFEILVRN